MTNYDGRCRSGRAFGQGFDSPQVHLINNQQSRHIIRHCRGKKTVDECGVGGRIRQRHHQRGHVDVGCKNVALLRQVRRTPDDVIAARLDGCDECSSIGIQQHRHPVANSHRIGAAYALEPEIAFYFAIMRRAIVGKHHIPATRIPYYQSVHICS